MPRRLSLLIPSLSQGGAEAFVSRLANHWAGTGHAVQLVTLDVPEQDSFELDPRIERAGLGLMSGSSGWLSAVRNNLGRVRALRAALETFAPDCAISFLESMNVLSILASRGRSWSVLISERTDPRYHRVGRLWTRLRRIWYPQADGLIVQTRDVASFMRPMMQDKPVTVIPNGVAAGIGQRAMFDREFLVLGVGRLSPEKRFDRLIQAFADAALDQQTAGPIANNASSRLQRGEGLQEAAEERPAQPQWRLVILGEGPQRSQLEQLVQSLGMNDRVALPGFVQSTTDWLQRCSVFVLTSRYEGFPNALLEAMANGCAVIANDCPSGPAEIVRDNVDGWLVAADDMPQLVTRLRAAMASLDERSRVARRAVEVSQRFSLEACFAAWDEVVDEAIRQSDAQRER